MFTVKVAYPFLFVSLFGLLYSDDSLFLLRCSAIRHLWSTKKTKTQFDIWLVSWPRNNCCSTVPFNLFGGHIGVEPIIDAGKTIGFMPFVFIGFPESQWALDAWMCVILRFLSVSWTLKTASIIRCTWCIQIIMVLWPRTNLNDDQRQLTANGNRSLGCIIFVIDRLDFKWRWHKLHWWYCMIQLYNIDECHCNRDDWIYLSGAFMGNRFLLLVNSSYNDKCVEWKSCSRIYKFWFPLLCEGWH